MVKARITNKRFKTVMKLILKGLAENIAIPLLGNFLHQNGNCLPKEDCRHIIAIKFGNMGDYTLILPALKAIKNCFPRARVTLICNNQKLSEILNGSPYIDHFYFFQIYDEKNDFNKIASVAFAKELITLWRHRNSLRSCLLLNFSHLKSSYVLLMHLFMLLVLPRCFRVGFDTDRRGFFYQKSLSDQSTGNNYEAFNNLSLVSLIGAFTDEHLPDIPMGDSEIYGRQLLSQHKLQKYDMSICMVPGASKTVKHWASEKYAALANKIFLRYNAMFIFIGNYAEQRFIHEICELLDCPFIDLSGKISIKQMVSVIKSSSLFIGNDSGPMHIAIAMRTPSVIIGHTKPSNYTAYSDRKCVVIHPPECPLEPGIQCRIAPECGKKRCIDTITPEKVYETVVQIIEM